MRDNFSARIKEILAKRVTYRCCNPDCKRPTIGPNSKPEKTISIGVAAHITAASVGGPRYNETLKPHERVDISNGIWLCQNCSVLIDKDERKYTEEILKIWKNFAEDEASNALQNKSYSNIKNADEVRPYAEAELIWIMGLKSPRGASPKTISTYGEMPISNKQMIGYHHVEWKYKLIIFNNSTVGLFNLKVILHPSYEMFQLKNELLKINNMPPYKDLSIWAETSTIFEGTGDEACKITNIRFPYLIQGLRLLLEYSDEKRKPYFTELRLDGQVLNIIHYENKPIDYELI